MGIYTKSSMNEIILDTRARIYIRAGWRILYHLPEIDIIGERYNSRYNG